MKKQAQRILRQVVPWLRQESSGKTNYKGVRGRIGIVGGARDYAGAPYFASMSCMRLGADLAYVVCSREASQAIKNYSADLIVIPLLDCPDEAEFAAEMDCLMSRLHALVVGPGLGREKLLQDRAKKLIEKAKASSMPLILDADSLLMVNQDQSLVRSYPNALLTPNRIELQRMLDHMYTPKTHNLKTMKDEDIQKLVAQCSQDLDVTILAKGLVDIVSHKPAELQLLTNANSGSDRRCGGQGDITCGLAGVYAHWIGQANSKLKETKITHPMAWAGYLAAMTTRRCNELAHKEFGQGALASNMIDKIQCALKSLIEEGDETINGEACFKFRYSGLLTNDEIKRYGRQMAMEEFGPKGQVKLKKASALIIGAGGLGCPAAVYLGAGGLGKLGIVDDDRVEISNLHRQILHNIEKVGMLKTESVKQAVLAINPNIKIATHNLRLDRSNAVDLIEQYDIIVDCTDNLLARYLISDACVVAKKPLVSGAALKMDGQLTVYNYDESTPCFRCLFPEAPPPNAVGSCSENGVLGVLPGIIGVNQAIEAMKMGAGLKPAYAGKMLLYDGQLGLYRQVTLKKRDGCEACGVGSKLTRQLIDYEKFCGQTCSATGTSDNLLSPNERITVEDYSEIIKSGKAHVLIDVRPREQSDISRLHNALQLPVMVMLKDKEGTLDLIKRDLEAKNASEVYVVCRKGIASQRGARIIQETLKAELPNIVVKDIIGGMTTWEKRVDPKNYSCL